MMIKSPIPHVLVPSDRERIIGHSAHLTIIIEFLKLTMLINGLKGTLGVLCDYIKRKAFPWIFQHSRFTNSRNSFQAVQHAFPAACPEASGLRVLMCRRRSRPLRRRRGHVILLTRGSKKCMHGPSFGQVLICSVLLLLLAGR
jgi:hypothetical protein